MGENTVENCFSQGKIVLTHSELRSHLIRRLWQEWGIIMAVTYRKPKKQPKKFGFFFKISIVFLILGAVLHVFNWMFWGELSYFACCAVILAGIVYIILHHITYFTDAKMERVVSVSFYTSIACFILKLLSLLIFKEDYYMDISPFMEVHEIISWGLRIGVILLPLSVAIMLLKYNKLFRFIKHFF